MQQRTKNKERITNSGFSLIEVLIFLTIMSLVFVTSAAVVAGALNNLKINEHKLMATRYAEELLEWLKQEKEIDWTAFYSNRTPSSGSRTYCFNNDAIFTTSTWPSSGACGASDFSGIQNTSYPKIFKRQAVLERQGSAQVNITVTVFWQEASQTYSVPINSSVTRGE